MTARQELGQFVDSGRLRQACEGKLSEQAIDLAVAVLDRYCSPRRRRTVRAKP